MRKIVWASIVLSLVMIGFVTGFSLTTCSGSCVTTSVSTTTTTVTTASNISSHPLVGAFLYLWYGYNSSSHRWTGGLNTSHWNDSLSGVVKDKPSIGYYASLDNDTLATQISEMKDAGISVIIVSWWGTGNATQSVGGAPTLDGAIDNATLNLFHFLEATKGQWQFKVAIMVEPFNPNYTMTAHDYAKLYGYLYTRYYHPYSDLILRWPSKPLLLSFNSAGPDHGRLPPNSTFTYRQVGGAPNPVDWYFWTGMNFLDASGGSAEPQNYEQNPLVSSDGEVGIAPRYDDFYLRAGYMRFDYRLTEGMYSSEWNFVLGEAGNVSLVLIYSWNEYHERTAIEPHWDFTAQVNPDTLLNSTASYIAKLG